MAIDRLIRACTPEPGAWTTVAGARLKLGPVEPLPPGAAPAPAPPPGAAPVLAPGELLVTRHAVLAGTATEPVRLGEVQPPGKRRWPPPTGPAACTRPAISSAEMPPHPAGDARAARSQSAGQPQGSRRHVPGTPRGGVVARTPFRRVAYDVLWAVDQRDAYANLLLPALLRERGIEGRDAALATELTYGTLRGLQTYDAILDLCSDRSPGQIDPPVREVLRLGAHQLLATRVASHAAVATSVDLAKDVVGMRPAGFVNAVLRRVGTREQAEWLRIIAPDRAADPVGFLAALADLANRSLSRAALSRSSPASGANSRGAGS